MIIILMQHIFTKLHKQLTNWKINNLFRTSLKLEQNNFNFTWNIQNDEKINLWK